MTKEPNSIGRFIVTNYRVRFIKNGYDGSTSEYYEADSMPFPCIQMVTVPTGTTELKIQTKDGRYFKFNFLGAQQL